MSNIFKKSELDKLDKIVLKNGTTKNINSVIFPHTLKVGMADNSYYNATISGSIHHTHEGKSYLVAGSNITIVSASNGQVTVSSSGDITAVTARTGLSGGGTTGAVALSTNDSEIVHDNLSGFVSNEHIDHSGVSITAGNGLTGGGDITTSRTIAVGAGTGIDVAADSISVDVSDFMTNGVDNRIITATGADALNAEANLTFDGSDLSVVNGNILAPNNCFVSAYLTSTMSNLSTSTSHDIVFGGELYDTQSAYNTATGYFTAPVDGQYQVILKLRMSQLDTAASYQRIFIDSNGSNDVFVYIDTDDIGNDSQIGLYTFNFSTIIQLDQNDTIRVQFFQSGGSATTDIYGISSGASGNVSRFQIRLLQ